MRISKTTNHGNTRWRVTLSIQGKRKQRFFTSRDEARAWLNSIEADHTGFWNDRSDQERQDLINAFKLASNRGQSVYQSILSAPPSPKHKPLLLAEAVDIYIKLLNRRSLRPTSLKQTVMCLLQLKSTYPGKSCHELSSQDLECWFYDRKWKRSTIDGVIAKVSPFFSWCVREEHRKTNPCGAVKRPQSDDNAPTIFTPSQTEKLLKMAYHLDTGLVADLAVGLFAGVRPMEIERLHSSDIKPAHIEIKANKAKTRRRRLVTISDNLQEWLSLGGEFAPKNKRKRLSRILEAAGLSWSPDIMRHSFASYHLAEHQSAEKTALEMGHRDTKMLFEHYRELVTKEAAKRYWKIR